MDVGLVHLAFDFCAHATCTRLVTEAALRGHLPALGPRVVAPFLVHAARTDLICLEDLLCHVEVGLILHPEVSHGLLLLLKHLALMLSEALLRFAVLLATLLKFVENSCVSFFLLETLNDELFIFKQQVVALVICVHLPSQGTACAGHVRATHGIF